MTARTLFFGWVGLLVLVGVATAIWRHIDTGVPFFPGTTEPVWLVEARIDFQARGEPVLVSFNIPDDPPGYALTLQHTASPGYGFSTVRTNGILRGEWSIRDAEGEQTLYYKVQAVPDGSDYSSQRVVEPVSTPSPPSWTEAERTAAEQILARAQQASSTPQSLARQLIAAFRGELDDNAVLLLERYERVDLLVRLLHSAGETARRSMGLPLEDGRRNQRAIPILELLVDDHWIPFNPDTGFQGLEDNLLLWHRGGASLIDLFGGSNARVTFAMNRQAVPAEQLARMQDNGGALAVFSVYQLPIEQQTAFKLLLLLPLGALATVFLRILVGIRTSGTFMPVLIALAFLQTELLAGLIGFVGIVALGLLLRSYLSRLNLLLVARIATVIVIVVFLIGLISLLGYQLGFSTGMTLAFFPIIIIAWTIERMSILWEEEGPREVVIQGGGSLLVALAAYLMMSRPLAEYLTFNFPELNLVVVALIMLMGQYTGYRLIELKRFKQFEQVSR